MSNSTNASPNSFSSERNPLDERARAADEPVHLKVLMLKQRVRAARRDPVAFAEFAFTDESGRSLRLAGVHRELHAHLSGQPRALVELPRDHGKTTQVLIRVIWELGRDPNLR